jgi:acetolactate synthase I/II/III large subunit
MPSQEESPSVTGAEVIRTVISAYGTKTVFSLAGALHTALLDELDNAGVRIIGNRSESAVVEAADGYARVTGKPGVGLMIATQGAVNAVAGFATAYEAGSPVVIIIATPPVRDDDPWLGSFRRSSEMIGPFCKWQREVRSPGLLGEYIRAAFHFATSGRPGPVALSVPADFFVAGMPPVGLATPPGLDIPGQSGSRPARADVAAAARLLARSRRPVIIAGNGLRQSGAEGQLGEFARKFDLPVLLEGPARGGLWEDRDLIFPWAVAQTAAFDADVALVLGCRLGARLGWGRPPRFSGTAELIQVDVVAEEIGRGRHPAVGMAADLGAAVEDLGEELALTGYRGPGGAWLQDRLRPRFEKIDSIPGHTAGGLHPYAIARQLNDLMDGPVVYVGDGADIQTWMLGSLRLPAGSSWIDQRPLGSMGVGLPLAIGACAGEQDKGAAGEPARPVILVTGDGSLGYHLGELETASRCGLPIRSFVSNDGAWGTEKHGQLKKLGRALNTDLTVARYDVVAEGLGCAGFLVTNEEELASAVKASFAGASPAVVNVVVDPASGAIRKSEPLVEMYFYDELALRKAQSA